MKTWRVRDRRKSGRGGFTLVEAVLSTAVTAILMAGMGSAILLTSRAMPNGTSGGATTMSAGNALDLFAADLGSAKSIVSSSPTMIQFTVADRGGAAGDETIRYFWSGVAGTALTRQLNGGAATNVKANVQNFNLGYFKKAVTVATNQTVVSTGPEQLLATWTSYPSGSPTTMDFSIAASGANNSRIGWAGEYFSLGTLPANLTKITLTKVKLWMKSYAGSTADPTVSIYLAQGGGNPNPMPSSIGSPGTLSRSLLTSIYAPVTISLPADNYVTNTNMEYVVVVKGPVATPSVHLKYLFLNSGAPADAYMMQWSTNGGSSWQPVIKNRAKQDIPFEIYGIYETTTTTPVVTTTYYLQSVAMSLSAGTTPTVRLDTSLAVPNLPVVPGP